MLVKEEGSVKCTYYYIALVGLSHTCNVIAAKEVRMLGIATEYQNLMPVVTTNTTALSAIPEESFRVLYHLRYILGRQLFQSWKSQHLRLLSNAQKWE